MSTSPLKLPFSSQDLVARRDALRPLAGPHAKAPESDASDAVQAFLDLVWSHRDRIPAKDGVFVIHELFSATPRRFTEEDAEHRGTAQFDVFLDTLESYLGTNRIYKVQGIESYGFQTHMTISELKANMHVTPRSREYASRTLYHVTRKYGVVPSERIYVNVAPFAAAELFVYLVTNIVDRPEKFPTACSAKVSAPGNIRNDGLVLFLSKPDIHGALSALALYQRRNPSHFYPAQVKLTMRLDPLLRAKGEERLVGVSIGSEPPHVLPAFRFRDLKPEFLAATPSFGQFRCHVIANALEHTRSFENTKEAFVQRAVRYLGQSGVRQDAPHLHQDKNKLTAKKRDYAF